MAALGRAALAVFTTVALLLAVARGGTRFFVCPMTHLVFDESPCASPPDTALHAEDDGGPAVGTSDCCLERWRATAPAASLRDLDAHRVVPKAPIVAVLSPPGVDVLSLSLGAALPFAVARSARAGPPPPSATERRSLLMVFHC